MLAQALCILRRPQLKVGLPLPTPATDVETTLARLADVNVAAFLILHKCQGRTIIHESMKALLALAQRLLGPSAFRDVGHHGEGALITAILIKKGTCLHQHPQPLTFLAVEIEIVLLGNALA